jgi:hypothetical protein
MHLAGSKAPLRNTALERRGPRIRYVCCWISFMQSRAPTQTTPIPHQTLRALLACAGRAVHARVSPCGARRGGHDENSSRGHVIPMSSHADTRRNRTSLREADGLRINRLALDITTRNRAQRVRFPLAGVSISFRYQLSDKIALCNRRDSG